MTAMTNADNASLHSGLLPDVGSIGQTELASRTDYESAGRGRFESQFRAMIAGSFAADDNTANRSGASHKRKRDEFIVSLSDQAPFADDVTEPSGTNGAERQRLAGLARVFTQGVEQQRAGDPISRSSAVVRDVPAAQAGEAGGAPMVQFMSLIKATNRRLEVNAREYADVLDELFDSSCDELDEAVGRQLDEEKKLAGADHQAGHRRRSRRRRHNQLSTNASTAADTESLRQMRGGASSLSLGDDYADDDDDDEDLFDDPGATQENQQQLRESQLRERAKFAAGSGRQLHSQLNCFMCRFGNREYESVDGNAMANLRSALERGIGHRNIYAHAKMIHKMWLQTIYYPARHRGELMPIWRTRHVLEHMLSHDADPRMFLYLKLNKLAAFEEELSNMSLIKDEGGNVTLHKAHFKEWTNTVKLMFMLYKADPKKMNFFEENSQVNLSEANKRVEGMRVVKRTKLFGKK